MSGGGLNWRRGEKQRASLPLSPIRPPLARAGVLDVLLWGGGKPASEAEAAGQLGAPVFSTARALIETDATCPPPLPARSFTLKSVIKLLASDLGVDPAAVKAHKAALKASLEALLAESADAEPEPEAEAPPPSAKKASTKKESAASASEEEGEEEEEEEDDDGAASDASTPPKKKAKPAPRPAKPPPARRELPAAAVAMRDVARQAGVTVPPSLYARTKTDDEVVAGFEALLAKYDLTADADAASIRAAKARVKRERELDGIDTSNVLDADDAGRGGRRTRGARVDYSKVLAAPKLDSDDSGDKSEEEDDDDDDDDDTAASDSDASGDDDDGSPTPAKKKGSGKNGSDDEAEASDEESE